MTYLFALSGLVVAADVLACGLLVSNRCRRRPWKLILAAVLAGLVVSLFSCALAKKMAIDEAGASGGIELADIYAIDELDVNGSRYYWNGQDGEASVPTSRSIVLYGQEPDGATECGKAGWVEEYTVEDVDGTVYTNKYVIHLTESEEEAVEELLDF